MDYLLISLKEALELDEIKDIIPEAIERFSIPKDLDVTNFLQDKALEHTNFCLSPTYLFLVEDDEYKIEILAYFTIVNNKVFSIKHVSDDYRNKILIDNDKSNSQFAILIAQLGRNSKYNSSDLNLNDIMNDVLGKIKEIVKLGGGRFIIIECGSHHIDRYVEEGFHHIKKNSNNALHTLMMFSKDLR